MSGSSEQTVTPDAAVNAPVVDEPAAAEENKPKAVFVENLSPSVTVKTLNDFFSLCGPIESISLRPKPGAEDGTLEATVFFETSGAADTAVLLTNAMLVERTISISYYNGASSSSEGDKAKEEGNDSATGNTPSVWASLLAASYKFSDDVRARAAEVDTKYGVSKGFAETVDKIDQTLGLTQKFNTVSTAVQQKSEELGVNQKFDALGAGLASAGESIKGAANSVFDSAMQNQYVSSAWTTLAGWGSSLISGWTQITQEADQLYTQQTGNQRNASQATAEPASASAGDADVVSVPADASQQEPQPSAPVEPAPADQPAEVPMPNPPAN